MRLNSFIISVRFTRSWVGISTSPTGGEWWVCLCVEICIVLQQFYYHNLTVVFISEPCFTCDTCGRTYRAKRSLWRHRKYECQKEPAFKCLHPKCLYKAKQKGSVIKHMMNVHSKAACLYWYICMICTRCIYFKCVCTRSNVGVALASFFYK